VPPYVLPLPNGAIIGADVDVWQIIAASAKLSLSFQLTKTSGMMTDLVRFINIMNINNVYIILRVFFVLVEKKTSRWHFALNHF